MDEKTPGEPFKRRDGRRARVIPSLGVPAFVGGPAIARPSEDVLFSWEVRTDMSPAVLLESPRGDGLN